jgi:hypothetical protein
MAKQAKELVPPHLLTPEIEKILDTPPPALDDYRALTEWHWMRFYAIAQIARKRGQLRDFILAERAMLQLEELPSPYSLRIVQPMQALPSANIEISADSESAMREREAAIVAAFQNRAYRVNDQEMDSKSND